MPEEKSIPKNDEDEDEEEVYENEILSSRLAKPQLLPLSETNRQPEEPLQKDEPSQKKDSAETNEQNLDIIMQSLNQISDSERPQLPIDNEKQETIPLDGSHFVEEEAPPSDTSSQNDSPIFPGSPPEPDKPKIPNRKSHPEASGLPKSKRLRA
jgi:hypothetical protein